ncbi:MAG: DUF1624 domain-containing protein [Bryobacterales bacterium]|nr:DUF1624 domain-containing protein [Bryobacterales bacterium]
MASSFSAERLRYIDWLRGFAAVIMLQGHTFHSFAKPEIRDGGPYVLSQFVGGMPPAIFLFLLGVTLAFRMDGGQRRGAGAWERVSAALRRAGYLLSLAFLFRLQLWAFAGASSPWTDLLRVDILNCMALAVAAFSTLGAFTTAERARLGALLGLSVAAAAPVASQLHWHAAPAMLQHYLAPDALEFGFFPWAAFLAFGVSAGSILRLVPEEQMDRLMQWGTLLGGGLIVGGRFFGDIPYSLYPASNFWLDSPALTLIKLGILLWMLAFAYLWTRYAAPGWSWVAQLGATSLLVYWVHVELVYGRWFDQWKDSMDVAPILAFTVLLTLAMLGLSLIRTRGPEALRALFAWAPWPERSAE